MHMILHVYSLCQTWHDILSKCITAPKIMLHIKNSLRETKLKPPSETSFATKGNKSPSITSSQCCKTVITPVLFLRNRIKIQINLTKLFMYQMDNTQQNNPPTTTTHIHTFKPIISNLY